MKVISKLYFIYCLIFSELSLCDSLVWCGVTVLGVYSTLVLLEYMVLTLVTAAGYRC